jgi:hypothetical protein
MSNATVPSLRSLDAVACAMFLDGAPNLDGLGASADEFRSGARILSALAEYLDLIALAHDARTEGRIPDALRLESRAERIYNRLPQGARW